MSLWCPAKDSPHWTAGRPHPVTPGWASEPPVLIYRETRFPAHTFRVRVSRQEVGHGIFRTLR